MPTTITRYVNTNSTAGGDGTTNATSGANRAYATLSAWESARQRDLVAADEIEVVECSGTAADTTATTIDGWTTDSTRYIIIKCTGANKHTGTWDTNKYRLTSSASWALLMSTNFTRIEGLQISGNNVPAFYVWASGSTTLSFRLSGCILRQTHATGTTTICSIQKGGAGGVGYLYNNLLVDMGTSANGIANSVGNSWQGTLYVENNTIAKVGAYSAGKGIEDANSTIARNNLFYGFGNTNSYVGTFESGTDNNATDSSDSIGTGSSNRTSQTFTFVDAASGDYRITAADTGAKGYGMALASLSSGLTDDFIGTARPATGLCIGCHEVVADTFIPYSMMVV